MEETFGGGLWTLAWIVIYLFTAYCYFRIAVKLKRGTPWFAFIPILNMILMLQMVKKPLWWVILMFIPFVNMVIGIMVVYYLMKELGKPGWWTILMILPIVNFVILALLAFEKNTVAPSNPTPPTIPSAQ
ncbi:hypothetical protein HN958_02640 [Candidatus Falkowbacteria bacterium]|jgi:hypothetical protein|nr:hypothetical protein [Candidatus Falkowbacteria bacterium]MBT7007380.1 hypothetical protein [Candidatus Falkowbacteria bacterium]